MRLTAEQSATIRRVVGEEAGPSAEVRLFGSRLDDEARGGDIDLLVQLPFPIDNPALLAARIAARLIRALDGRHVDVILSAPNLMNLPIHQHALEGALL